MGTIISFVVTLAVVLLIAKFVFKVGGKAIIGFLVNALVGAIVIWVLNLFGLGLPLTWLTSVLVGCFGIFGVIIVVVLKFVFHLI